MPAPRADLQRETQASQAIELATRSPLRPRDPAAAPAFGALPQLEPSWRDSLEKDWILDLGGRQPLREPPGPGSRKSLRRLPFRRRLFHTHPTRPSLWL